MPKCYIIPMKRKIFDLPARRPVFLRRRRKLRRFAAGLLILAAVAAAAILLVCGRREARSLTVRRQTVRLADWPEAHDNLRIAVVADLHLYPGILDGPLLTGVFATLATEQPDLIFLLGDFVNYRGPFALPALPEITRVLRRFRAPHGVFAVPGNHDTYLLDHGLRQAIRDAGVILLENHGVRRQIHGEELRLAGVGDYTTAGSDVIRAARNFPPDAPFLLLSHNPKLHDLPREDNPAPLAFSGHTHGGQIRLPWIGARYLPWRKPHLYDPGLHRRADDGRQLLLSSGVGTSTIPIRFLSPPEIVIVTLRGKNTDEQSKGS